MEGSFFKNETSSDIVTSYYSTLSPTASQRAGASEESACFSCEAFAPPGFGYDDQGNVQPNAWQAATQLAAGYTFIDNYGNLQTVQRAGATGLVQPNWAGIGSMTPDGTVVWICSASSANWQSAFLGGAETWQGTPADMVALQAPDFVKGAPESLGTCHKMGFKKYAAARRWHGCYGFNSNDAAAADLSGIGMWPVSAVQSLGTSIFDSNGNLQTVTAVTGDSTTGSTPPNWATFNGTTTGDNNVTWTCCTEYHHPRMAAPDQLRYGSLSANVRLNDVQKYFLGQGGEEDRTFNATITGTKSVNLLSGEITSSIVTAEQDYTYAPNASPGSPFNPQLQVLSASGGMGWTQGYYGYTPLRAATVPVPAGLSTLLDSVMDSLPFGVKSIPLPADYGNGNEHVTDLITDWNTYHPTATLPQISNPNSYSASAVDSTASPADTISISFSKSAAGCSWDISFFWKYVQISPNPDQWSFNYSGSLVLGGANPASGVLTDAENLLAEWSLNGPEPWRTDAWTSIMPLVCRREVQTTALPTGSSPGTVDNLAAPLQFPAWQALSAASAGEKVVDGNGNVQICVASGTTGASAPAWETSLGVMTVDGTAVWGLWAIDGAYGQTSWFDPASYFWVYAPGTTTATGLKLMMDGAVIGSPNKFGAGATGWFDFYFTDERFCPCVTSGGCESCPAPYAPYTYAFGGNLADAQLSLSGGQSGPAYSTFLPNNATHWTGNVEAHNIPRGAIVDLGGIFGSPATDPIAVVKAAFTRLPVPSYNFGRPCGSDRVLIDEVTAQCFTSGLTMGGALPDQPEYPALSAQQVLIYGSPSSDGIWLGVTQSGSTLTLPAQNVGVNYWPLPSDYFHPFGGGFTEGGGLAGIVRFSGLCGSTGAAAICGRQPIATQSSGVGTTIIAFASPQTNLRTGDRLDLWDLGMGTVAAGAQVTRIDDEHFSVALAQGYVAAAWWATSTGAKTWYWDDATQKFEYRYGTWKNESRWPTWGAGMAVMAGEIITDGNGNFQVAGNSGITGQNIPMWNTITGGNTADNGIVWTCTANFSGCIGDCRPYSPCRPQVMAFTPNNDRDSDWSYAWFPASGTYAYIADGVYGSRSQGNVEFETNDLLYQTPLCPCTNETNSFNCAIDDGTCQADQVDLDPEMLWAPPPPRMEARCGTITGTGNSGAGPGQNLPSPPLPRDALGLQLQWPGMVQPQNPGQAGSFYNVVLESWMRYQNELASDPNGGCRWSAYYYSWTLGNGH